MKNGESRMANAGHTKHAATSIARLQLPRECADELLAIGNQLVETLSGLRFAAPVSHVYNPLDYARRGYAAYIERFATKSKEVVLLGMNPGPWGMVQTGVPFGEVAAVRDWMGVAAGIGKPRHEHPRRPVEGFACRRSEVSGARLWGWAQKTFGSADLFFRRFLVLNYCPLAFMEASGRNLTPDRLPTRERAPLFEACDAALRDSVVALAPRYVIGIGGFAATRARIALAGLDVTLGQMLHPSPASPAANRDWATQAVADLRRCGIRLP